MAFCRNCGNELNDGAKFCPKCGNEVTKMFVDMEGKMYSNYGYSDFDAVGNRDCYQATFKRIK